MYKLEILKQLQHSAHHQTTKRDDRNNINIVETVPMLSGDFECRATSSAVKSERRTGGAGDTGLYWGLSLFVLGVGSIYSR
jgi:hypothetical protein